MDTFDEVVCIIGIIVYFLTVIGLCVCDHIAEHRRNRLVNALIQPQRVEVPGEAGVVAADVVTAVKAITSPLIVSQ